MTKIPFAHDPAFQLPHVWHKQEDRITIVDAMKVLFEKYRAALVRDMGQPGIQCAQSVDKICSVIVEIHQLLLLGEHAEAYSRFDDMTKVMGKLTSGFPIRAVGDNFPLYRVRLSNRVLRDRGDLFHIPFESRNLVSTQRYSAPGVPSLYLGASLYSCWLELGQPPFHKINFSRFQVPSNKKLRVVDLCYDLPRIEKEQDENRVFELLTWWPLLAAMSFCRKHEKAPFHEEYIMPHLFMENCLAANLDGMKSYDGIMYLSSNERSIGDAAQKHVDDISLLTNIILFSRTIKDIGHCSILSDKIRLTKPISWQFFKAIGSYEGNQGIYRKFLQDGKEMQTNNNRIGITTENGTKYNLTDFCSVENSSKWDEVHRTVARVDAKDNK